jgi:hypothetical protein
MLTLIEDERKELTLIWRCLLGFHLNDSCCENLTSFEEVYIAMQMHDAVRVEFHLSASNPSRSKLHQCCHSLEGGFPLLLGSSL